mgnify:CR=1 FL=1
MRDSLNKALLFVIALSTSIIAVELVSVSRVNKLKLLCAEFNSIDFNNRKKVVEKTNPELISVRSRARARAACRPFCVRQNSGCSHRHHESKVR